MRYLFLLSLAIAASPVGLAQAQTRAPSAEAGARTVSSAKDESLSAPNFQYMIDGEQRGYLAPTGQSTPTERELRVAPNVAAPVAIAPARAVGGEAAAKDDGRLPEDR